MTRYAVSLGSNQGDRHQLMADAVEALAAASTDWTVSSIYETEPVGGPEQDPFLNAVFVGEFDLDPLSMLDLAQSVENRLGRVRSVRWGPRTMDCDLVVSDGQPYSDDRLQIPHPRAAERAFVLAPLAEVWPEALIGAKRAEELRAVVDRSGVDLLIRDWLPPISKTGPMLWVTGQFALFLLAAVLLSIDGTLPEGEVTVLRVLGAAIAITGAVMAFVSVRRIGPEMTASPVPNKSAPLVDTGPFRLVRHPIYGGVSMLLMGTSLVLDSLAGFGASLLLVGYFIFKSRYEEKRLRLEMPEYRAYMERVRLRLIPFIL